MSYLKDLLVNLLWSNSQILSNIRKVFLESRQQILVHGDLLGEQLQNLCHLHSESRIMIHLDHVAALGKSVGVVFHPDHNPIEHRRVILALTTGGLDTEPNNATGVVVLGDDVLEQGLVQPEGMFTFHGSDHGAVCANSSVLTRNAAQATSVWAFNTLNYLIGTFYLSPNCDKDNNSHVMVLQID